LAEQKFDPVQEFVTLRDNISKAVGQSLRTTVGAIVFPALDVYETEEAVIVLTEPLVGIVKSSVEVSIEDDLLTLSGETEPPVHLDESQYLHRELRFGKFTRSISIPRRVRHSEASATFRDGMLWITLPKENVTAGQIISITPAE
jgi:HSP20 family protein